jgi:hypothetical protein
MHEFQVHGSSSNFQVHRTQAGSVVCTVIQYSTPLRTHARIQSVVFGSGVRIVRVTARLSRFRESVIITVVTV